MIRFHSVTLLTDFGSRSPYPGVMKSVLLGLAPGVPVIDLHHDVAPGAVREAAYVLEAAWPYLPSDGVVVIVVDPGVGSKRRILALTVESRVVLAPDNGVLEPLLERPHVARCVTRPDLLPLFVSSTFHGRDVFAPVAAALVTGRVTPEDLGSTVTDPVRGADAHARRCPDGGLEGVVVHVDTFGNLVTNLLCAELPQTSHVFVGTTLVASSSSRTFSDVPPGHLLVYGGSSGHLEIAVRDDSAEKRLGAGRGAIVRVVSAAGSSGRS